MSDYKVRLGCVARGLNLSKDRSCSEDDPCMHCRIDVEIEENKDFYDAMGDV